MDDNTNPLRTTPSIPPRSGAWPDHASPRPWTYHRKPSETTPGYLDWIEDANGNIVVEYVGHIDGPAICAAVNARSTLADPIPEAPADDLAAAQTDIEPDIAAIIYANRSQLRSDYSEAPADEEVERGWLIELKPSVARQPTWFHLDDEWTTDSTKALRFARKADAEAFIAHSGWTEAFASEHMWGLPASRAALRRSTETDKPGVREALEALRPFAEAFAKADDPGVSDLYDEQPFSLHVPLGAWRRARSVWRRLASPLTEEQPVAKFKLGDRVQKIKGSAWRGHVVGTYSTGLTPEGYNVESENEPGSVQLYPAAALETLPRSTTGGAK